MGVFAKQYSSSELETKLAKVDSRRQELESQMAALRPKIAEKEAVNVVDGGNKSELDKLRREYADARDEL